MINVLARLRQCAATAALRVLVLTALTGAAWAAGSGERFTEYEYDEAGRLVRVGTVVDEAPPVASGIEPGVVRRGPPVRVTVSGSSLRAAAVAADDAGITIAAVTARSSEVSFDVTVAEAVPLGLYTLTLTTVLGQATVALEVRPRLPVLQVSPNPIVLAPGTNRLLDVRLDTADVIDHTFEVTASNPLRLTADRSILTIPAGALVPAETLSVNALTLGTAALWLESTEVRPLAVLVFITAPYAPPAGGASFWSPLLGVNVSTSAAPALITRGPFIALLGVVRTAPVIDDPANVSPVAAPLLGVTHGTVVHALTPRLLVRGAGPATVTASGIGLGAVTTATLRPSKDVTVALGAANGDGTQLELTLEAAADAALGARELVLTTAAGTPLPFASAQDRITVVTPIPEIDSVAPILLARGTPSATLTLRGRRFSGASAVQLSPPDGLIVSAQPQVSADGQTLTVAISVAADALLGARTISVATAAGSSDPTAGSHNTVTVVSQITSTVAPVAAPLLGVMVASSNVTNEAPYLLATPPLGVTRGAVFTGLQPSAAMVGQTLTVQALGYDLQAVTGARIEPPADVTLDSVTAAADGETVALELTVAASATQGVRRVVLETANGDLLPSNPHADLLSITDVLPEVDSLTPILLVAGGAPVTVAVRGRHFGSVTGVALAPPEGIGATAPVIAGDGESLTVTIAAAADAALGARVLSLVTPTGTSSTLASAANTLQVVSGIAGQVTPLAAPLLGVTVGNSGQSTTTVAPLAAPLLGVTVAEAVPLVSSPVELVAVSLGVAVGAAAKRIVPAYLPAGLTTDVVVEGVALSGIDALSFVPPDGITVTGAPVVAVDGHSLTATLAIDATAPQTARRMVLSAAGVERPFAGTEAGQVRVVGSEPLITSIAPIQVLPGQTFTLTVRGVNLFGASQVLAEPATGLSIGVNPTINATGTEVQVIITVAANATGGPRVIRVVAAGGTTGSDATAANTLNVVTGN